MPMEPLQDIAAPCSMHSESQQNRCSEENRRSLNCKAQ
jgi:hypothetical protein